MSWTTKWQDIIAPKTKSIEETEPEPEFQVIDKIKGAGFTITILQCGSEYRGSVKFASREKVESLFSTSLSHLRSSLFALATQGTTTADLAADSPDPIPSNSDPSFDFRNGQ
jgi:hypothetical protein